MNTRNFVSASNGLNSPPQRQRGAATIFVAVLLLVILSVAVLFAVNVGFFEQKTATNQARSKMAEAAAEYELNLGGEFFKANSARISSDTAWLGASGLRWVPCSVAAPTGTQPADPCLTLPNPADPNVYRYVHNGSMAVDYSTMVAGAATGSAIQGFNVSTSVTALLCLLDITSPANPVCRANPANRGQFGVTLVASSEFADESARAEVKQTLATYQLLGPAAKVPLVASGTVGGLGSAEIVAAPNAGGPGVPASIWSPCPVDIEAGSGGGTAACPSVGSGGIGSVITCQLGEFLGSNAESSFFTACTTGSCGCPNDLSRSLSGHGGGSGTREGVDILDIDGGAGANADITYFPKEPYDNPADPLDDSLFEVLFNADVVTEGTTTVRQDCGPDNNEDCQVFTLHELKATEYGSCSSVPASTGGLFWVGAHAAHTGNVGTCNLPPQVGTPESPAILVLDGNTQLSGNTNFYGVIFLRSSDGTAQLTGGSNNFYAFGSTFVEGTVDVTGMHFVYSESLMRNLYTSPLFQRFARVPGSWLDSRTAL